MKLKKKNIQINIYDDLIKKFKNFNIFKDPEKAVKKSDILILMREFKKITVLKKLNLKKLLNKKYIIDPFGILEIKIKKYINKKNFFYYKKLGSS